MKQFTVFLLTVLASLPSFAAKKRLLVDLNKNKGEVEFLAVGKPSFLKIRGKGATLKGKLLIAENHISGRLKVPLKEFDTGMSLRNRHMKDDYLEVKKYPTADLTISKVKLPAKFLSNPKAEAEEIPFNAKLKLHGKVQRVRGVANLKRQGKQIVGDAKFDIDLTQFNIDIPSFKGITVAKKVTITTRIDSPTRMVKLKAR